MTCMMLIGQNIASLSPHYKAIIIDLQIWLVQCKARADMNEF